MAARAAPGGNNTYMMSPSTTLDRNNVVKFDEPHSIETPRSPIAEKLNPQQSGLHKRTSLDHKLDDKSEREIQDLPRNAKEGLFTRLLSFKWKSDAKDDEKDIC